MSSRIQMMEEIATCSCGPARPSLAIGEAEARSTREQRRRRRPLQPYLPTTMRRSPFLLSTGQALSSYPWASMGQVQNSACADSFEAPSNPILPFIWKARYEP